MIFVTGGTGFLGAHLLMELCDGGKKVRALKRPSSDIGFVKSLFSFYHKEDLFGSIEWVDGDLSDIESWQNALQGAHHIYHCAATVSFSRKNRDFLFENNVKTTASLIDASIQKGVKKFCHVSSIAALGKDALITEKTLWDKKNDHSVYGQTKYESEMEAWRGMAEGMETIIVNPSVIIGPWKTNSGLGKFFKQIEKGLQYYTSGCNAFVDVRDVAKAMIMLMDSDIKNESFIVSAENLSFRDLSTMVAQLIGVKAPTVSASKCMTGLAWRLAAVRSFMIGKEADFTKDTARISQSTSVYSNQKITEALHFSFIPVNESLAHYYKFYKQYETLR